ncbi:hypothetical protein BS78_09G195200 [Paspalum vaginatum]|nr:hypothetical protein BS78_09G195200 [Paspalum vaginatum]
MSSSLANSAVAGTVRSRSMWRHDTAAGGTLHLPRIRRGVKLSLCCAHAPPSDLDPKWWRMPLTPEDLVEPTGQGLEELEAIWNALVQDPLQPILTALQEIKATKGDLFRCRWFHPGIVSGPLLLVGGFPSELKGNGKSNILCARMQHVLLAILLFKGDHSNKGPYCYFTRMTWAFVLYVNSCVVVYELIGVKHPKRYLEALFKTLLTKGVIKVLKALFLGIE